MLLLLVVSVNTIRRGQHFSIKGPNSKYFRLCKPKTFIATTQFHCYSWSLPTKKYKSTEVCLWSNKISLTIVGNWPTGDSLPVHIWISFYSFSVLSSIHKWIKHSNLVLPSYLLAFCRCVKQTLDSLCIQIKVSETHVSRLCDRCFWYLLPHKVSHSESQHLCII